MLNQPQEVVAENIKISSVRETKAEVGAEAAAAAEACSYKQEIESDKPMRTVAK